MSRTNKFLINVFSLAVLQIISILSGFIIPRILINTYGSEINGFVISISQFISYFILVESGLSAAAVYSLYKPLASKDDVAVNGIISAVKKSYTKIALYFIVLVTIFSIAFPVFVKSEVLLYSEMLFIIILIGFNGVIDFITLSKYKVLLTADQKTYVISFANIIYYILIIIITWYLASLSVSIMQLRFWLLFAVLSRSSILHIYTKIKYRNLNFKAPPNHNALKEKKHALYLEILGAVNKGAPIVLLTIILNDLKIISVYAVYNMVILGVSGLLGIIITGLPASFGELIVKSEHLAFKTAYRDFEFIYHNVLIVIYTILGLSLMPFINLYTNSFVDTIYYLPVVGYLFVLNGLTQNIKNPQGMLVIAAGKYRETKIQTTIQGALLIIIAVVLIPKYGIIGVLIANIVSNVYRTVDLLLFVPDKIVGNTPKYGITKTIVSTVLIIVYILLGSLIKVNITNYSGWLIYSIVIATVVTILQIIISIVFEPKASKSILYRIKQILSKKRRIENV